MEDHALQSPLLNRPSGYRGVFACSVAYSLMSLLFGLQLSVCGPCATLLAQQAGVHEADLAPMMAAGGIGMTLGGYPSGWIVDRLPGHSVLAFSHLVQAIGFFLIPLCPSVLWLTIVYFGISLTFSATNTALNCMAIWLLTPAPGAPQPPITVAFLLNTISALFGVGALIAPQIVHVMSTLTGSGINIFYCATSMSVAVILSFLVLPSSPTAPPPVLSRTVSLGDGHSHVAFSPGRHPSPVRHVLSFGGSHARLPAAVAGRSSFDGHSGRGSRGPSRGTSHGPSRGEPCRDGLAAAVHAALEHDQEERGSHGGVGSGSAGGGSPKACALASPPLQHSHLEAVQELPLLLHAHTERSKRWKGQFLACALMLIFANISVELGFGNWIFTYCIRQADLSENAGQQITSLFWLAFTLGRVPAMIMVAYVSVSTIMAITMPLAIVGALLPLVFNSNWHPGAGGGEPPLLAASPPPPGGEAGSAFTTVVVSVATVLVAVGSAAGAPCTLSLATEYINVDGYVNGLIGTVAGLGATTFPYLVPVLAQAIPRLGFQCLMAATLVMAMLQLASLVAMLSVGRALGKIADSAHKSDADGQKVGADGGLLPERPPELEEPLLHPQAGAEAL